jgi:hypothetical protein
VTTKTERKHRLRFICPQCGCPTDGSLVDGGDRSSFCEDCVGDREIADMPYSLAD